jgi:hypothetical protein
MTSEHKTFVLMALIIAGAITACMFRFAACAEVTGGIPPGAHPAETAEKAK